MKQQDKKRKEKEKKEKKRKDVQNRKKEIKLSSLFPDNIIVHVECHKESTKYPWN